MTAPVKQRRPDRSGSLWTVRISDVPNPFGKGDGGRISKLDRSKIRKPSELRKDPQIVPFRTPVTDEDLRTPTGP